MDTLKDILANFFNINEMKPETTFKLKLIFDALDRPEFLNRVPKVRHSCREPTGFKLSPDLFFFARLVLESAGDSFKCGDTEGVHDSNQLRSYGF